MQTSAEAKTPRRAKLRITERVTTNRSAAKPSKKSMHGRIADMQPVVDQLRALEDARKDGTIALPDGSRLGVTNLAKLFWPKLKLTKGDLLRYYATVAPLILPVVADRPLVMKRFPNGVDDRVAFYQQRRQKEQPPAGVRIETLPDDLDPIDEPGAERFIGGSLITLLYMTQLAAISQDPWFSRVQSPLDADYVAIDLDPGEGATLAQVLDVARWVRDELESMKVPGVPKTSGSRGLHIYIPLPPGTSYESGQLFCQIVATVDRRRGIRRSRPSSAWSRSAGAAPSTSTSCRTSSARRWRAPTARAPATSPASPRRSRGRKSTPASTRATSPSSRRRRASARSAICGRGCARRSRRRLETVFGKYASRRRSAGSDTRPMVRLFVVRCRPAPRPRHRSSACDVGDRHGHPRRRISVACRQHTSIRERIVCHHDRAYSPRMARSPSPCPLLVLIVCVVRRDC